MQVCPDCGRVYDESDSSMCPYCYPPEASGEKMYIVFDREAGEAKIVPADEAWKYD